MSRIRTANTRRAVRLAAPLLLASALGACSSIPDWVDPTTWLGGDNQASSDQNTQTADASQSGDSDKTPDIAAIPAKPAPPSTPDEQKQVSDSLAADRTQTQYSTESLQGGTEPAAAPPPAETSPPAETASAPASAASESARSDNATSVAQDSAEPAAASENAARPSSEPSGTQVASTESPSTTAPAAAPMAAATATLPAVNMQASFAASQAPALDRSVAKYVPERILSRYRQTAAAAAVPGVEGMPAAVRRPARHRKAKAAQPAPDATAAPSP